MAHRALPASTRLAVVLGVFWVLGAALGTDPESPATADDMALPGVDWEALLQQPTAQKLKVAGDAAVAADLDVKGAGVFGGHISAAGATFEEAVEVKARLSVGGGELVLGQLDTKQQGQKTQNRALVHGPHDSLQLNFQGDFEGGVTVGSAATIKGKLVAEGGIEAKGPANFAGDALVLGRGDGKPQGQRPKNRALLHAERDTLVLNAKGDFEGGVRVEGPGLSTQGAVGIGLERPKADLHIMAAGGKEAGLLLSNTQKSSNAVFVKAVGGAGAGVDMHIGSTGGSEAYGRLSVKFSSKISFRGEGGTEFNRGDTVFAGGRVGVGSDAANPAHGVSVESDKPAGHPNNDISANKGSLRFHGALYDVSAKNQSFYLDLDKGGRMKALSLDQNLGVGTQLPSSPFSETEGGLLHVVDQVHPVVVLESSKGQAASIVFKRDAQHWTLQQRARHLKLTAGQKDVLAVDDSGRLGVGRENAGKYGVSIQLNEAENSPMNDLALPAGSIHMRGKIYDTFDGGDKYFLDPSHSSNIKDLSVNGKLGLGGVIKPKFELELPGGSKHITIGRQLFLGASQDKSRLSNNAFAQENGKLALHDKAKRAASIELGDGTVEFKTTKTVGKLDWQTLLGMSAQAEAIYTKGRLGIGTESPKHALEMAGGEAQFSLGNNLFINGGGDTNVIAANAYIKNSQWVIEQKDRFAASIHLKDDGKLDMYGTTEEGSAEWSKMLGFDAPKKRVYAFGKFGINTEHPTHTLTLPSGDHHISLGNNLFLNGAGSTTRIMGNVFMKLGKYTIADQAKHGLSIELNSAQSQIDFGGSPAPGSTAMLNLLSMNFKTKSIGVPSGRLGVRTLSPKVTADVRGHLNLQDPSNAAVIYSPATGAGLFIRVANEPGKYKKEHERYFFGSNSRVGFGTTSPEAKLHIASTKQDATLPHLMLATAQGAKLKLESDKRGFSVNTPECSWLSFAGGTVKTLEVYSDATEESQNGANYAKSAVLLAHHGGRVGIGAQPKSHHSLQITGSGALLSGVQGSPNTGVLAFANDGGGSGFQFDYSSGAMRLGSLPPTEHLKKESAQETYMTLTDAGMVGIGTDKPAVALTVKSDSGVRVENKAGASWTYTVANDGALEFSSDKGGFFAIDNEGGFHLNRHKRSEYKVEVSGKGLRLQADATGQAPLLFAPDAGGEGFRMDYHKKKMMFGHENGKQWHMTVADGGMVGIGTTAPMSGMHVKHNEGITIEHGGNRVQRWSLKTEQNAALSVGFMGSTKVTYTPNGWVGIGTDKPKKTLHVEGDVWVSGRMHVDNNFAAKLKSSRSSSQSASLSGSEALLELDEHTSGKANGEFGVVDAKDEPAEYGKLLAVMHTVLKGHVEEIRNLKARLAELEAKH